MNQTVIKYRNNGSKKKLSKRGGANADNLEEQERSRLRASIKKIPRYQNGSLEYVSNLRSAQLEERLNRNELARAQGSKWKNLHKDEREDRNFQGLIKKIQKNRESKKKQHKPKHESLNQETRNRIKAQYEAGDLNIHGRVVSRFPSLQPRQKEKSRKNVRNFNNLAKEMGLPSDLGYLPSITRPREPKAKKMSTVNIGKPKKNKSQTSLYEMHRKTLDSWNKFHKRSRNGPKNPGYRPNIDRFATRLGHQRV